jgi:hypothetical protein
MKGFLVRLVWESLGPASIEAALEKYRPIHSSTRILVMLLGGLRVTVPMPRARTTMVKMAYAGARRNCLAAKRPSSRKFLIEATMGFKGRPPF